MTHLFLLYTLKPFPYWRISLSVIGYSDDFTLMVVVPSPCVRVANAESLNLDLGMVSVTLF